MAHSFPLYQKTRLLFLVLLLSPLCVQAQFGRINVTSRPAAASVYLDGELKGETPMVINDVTSGNHQIVVRKQGYKLYSGSVAVASAKTISVQARLIPLEEGERNETMPEGIAKTAFFNPYRYYAGYAYRIGNIRHANEYFVGGFLKRFNFELNYIKGDDKAGSGQAKYLDRRDNKLKKYYYELEDIWAGHIGMLCAQSERVGLTLQGGFGMVNIYGSGDMEKTKPVLTDEQLKYISAGFRLECAITKWLTGCATSEFDVMVAKDDNVKPFIDEAATIRGWAMGLSLKIGFEVVF